MDQYSSSVSLLLVLAAFASSAQGQSKTEYFVVGEPLVLRPPLSQAVTSVVWTHNKNLVVEYLKGETEFFGPFINRTDLEASTGQLNITASQLSDVGEFKVEINKLVLSQGYMATAIEKVTKPTVVLRTLACDPHAPSCTFDCQGKTTGVGPVTYNWRYDDLWLTQERSEGNINLTSMQGNFVREIVCRMKNPVSEEESVPFKNPLYQENHTDPTPVAVGICVTLALLAVGGVCCWKRESIKRLLGSSKEPQDERAENSSAGVALNNPADEG